MQRHLIISLVSAMILFVTGCQSALKANVEADLFNPDQTGIRWGLMVADTDGTELLSMRADDRFTPASNTKVITTMAAYHALAELEDPSHNPGTQVFIEQAPDAALPSLVLSGGGDAMLQDSVACEQTCLSDLADQIAALEPKHYAAIIGDDTLFAFERWGVGWSLEDLQYYYGTAISALSVNDNLVWVDITPGAAPGDPATATWQDGDVFLDLDVRVTTLPASEKRRLGIEREPDSRTVRIYGEMPADLAPLSFGLAIDNPAEFAALRLKRHLEERGIRVDTVSTRHRPSSLADRPSDEDAALVTLSPATKRNPVASLAPTPLQDSLRRISKDSENLHADVLLRRLGLLNGTGSRSYGVQYLEDFLTTAGLPETAYALHGGSGMSIYNRVTPRGMVQLLAFAEDQPWWDAWLADQPIGGVDGSLKRRFKGTPLEGRIFAKTGTLNGANALSGMMIAASGRPLLFSIIANDRPALTGSAIGEMDDALNRIAAAY